MNEALAEVLDCTYNPHWDGFRRLLRRTVARLGSLDAVARVQSKARGFAEQLSLPYQTMAANEFALYVAQMSVMFGSVISGRESLAASGFLEDAHCHYGLLVVGHLWRDLLPRMAGDVNFIDIMLGRFHVLDFLSSSSWPVTYLDLLLGEEPTAEHGAAPVPPRRVAKRLPRSLASALDAGAFGRQLARQPLLRDAVDPQGCTCWRLGRCRPTAPPCRGPDCGEIRVAVKMGHISMTVDLGSVLLRAHPGVALTLVCGGVFELVAGAHMGSCRNMCDLVPDFCGSPRVRRAEGPAAGEVAYASADLLVCFAYGECRELWETHRKPMVLYDGTQYACPAGGVADTSYRYLEVLRGILLRDVYVSERRLQGLQLPHEALPGRSDDAGNELGALPEAPTFTFITDPWQAEALFFLTGIRVPSIRSPNFYIGARHDPAKASPVVLLNHDRGRCSACQAFVEVLNQATPSGYPLMFTNPATYTPFDKMALCRAMVLVPHGNVMQMLFREVTSMALPVFLPDVQLLARQPFLWWFDRMGGDGSPLTEDQKARLAQPPSVPGFSPPHPWGPFVLGVQAGSERMQAVLYWMQFLDYFHWPGVRHFPSLPALLVSLTQDAELEAASKALWAFVVRQRRLGLALWRDALPRLLAGSPPRPGGGRNGTTL